jgi:N-acetylneuraminic acid mutarotase
MNRTVALALILFILAFLSIVSAQPTKTSENSWTTKTNMPVASTCNAAVANGKIYVIMNNINYEYDPASDTWITKKPMPTPRSSFALASCQNKIYVIGGVTYSDPNTGVSTNCGLNEVYNPETDTWETKEPMPTARSQMRAEAVNGKIYVISGRAGEMDTTIKTTEVYDTATDTWETKAEILYPVTSGGSTVLDNKIYVIGGQDEYHDPMNPGFVQIYDPAADAWTQGTPHPNPAWLGEEVAATTGLYAPKRIYVMGGIEGIGMVTSDSYAYDPELDEWTVAASMPFPRSGFALATVDDVLYAIGGFNGWTTGYSDNLQYMPFGYGTIPLISSPADHGNYTSSNVPLTFELQVQGASLSYSLDEGGKVPLLGNTTLSDLDSGEHTVTIYTTDEQGNTSTLHSITFRVDSTFPTELVIASIATAVALILVGSGLLVYFKKRKHWKSLSKNSFGV